MTTLLQSEPRVRLSRESSEAMLKHDPVMVEEVLAALDPQPGDVIADGTLGLAGHSLQLAEKIAPGGTILGIDWDSAMLAEAQVRLSGISQVHLILERDDYKNLAAHARSHDLALDGILLDLGLNLAQIQDPSRGIAFSSEGPLDMRMDRTSGETAASFLNRASAAEIEKVLFELGDERWARAVARTIVERRRESPLRTTTDLVNCVLAAIPVGARDKRIHPATRTFQAIRIHINREFEGLQEALIEAASTLKVGGTMAVLSYHSGEDRIVKHSFRELRESGDYKELYNRPLQASQREIDSNPRSRSAKLRAIRRVSQG